MNTNIIKELISIKHQMLLNEHNLNCETSNHSTRVRIIISTDFTALVAEG